VSDTIMEPTAQATPPQTDAARAATERARDHLLALQDPAGWWNAELETNVTMDAEDLLLRQFLGIRGADTTARTAKWIRSQQRPDGTWGNFQGAPADVSTTVEAYVALRLAGDSPDDEHMLRASRYIRAAGGVEAARVFTRIWLALFGLWPWDELPALPPELMLLPPWVPLNVYDFACWARQTIVALTIVLDARPERELGFGIDELRTGVSAPVERAQRWTGAWVVERLERLARVYGRRPLRPLRALALARAERWIVRRQEADGSWGGIQPPWVYSLIALSLRGYPLDHPVMSKGLDGLERFTIEDGDVRRLEACQSPVWDTALSVIALADAGVRSDDPALLRAADWLLGEEVRVPGDWAVRRPELEPGGWSFEYENDNYPDVDDTAEVALALRRVDHPDRERVEAALARASRWMLGMQSRSGGFGAFDADNTRTVCRDLPFCDFGEVIDPPSADVTAHAIEALAVEQLERDPRTLDAIRWLLAEQEQDGAWFGRWGVNYIYGVGAAVPALVVAGMDPASEPIAKAIQWLEAHQNDDGGFGEDPRSYDDPAWRGRGASTASQTAWALIAMHAAGHRGESVERAVRWLVDTQRPDGTWDEPQFTGTGFPGDFYINYHLYRLVFPLMALGRLTR
jgi:squalene-hopene/tetraprenyl-beta-curcumene cyclase